MLKMKRNCGFNIEVKAGTNVEMSDEVFKAQLVASVLKAEQVANTENVRFHFTMGPTFVDESIDTTNEDAGIKEEDTTDEEDNMDA